ncbi:MAG: alpha-2-macroglobulin [Neisseriaceae bacterium]
MKKILASIFGQFDWKKPTWIYLFITVIKGNLKKVYSILAIILLTIILSLIGYWYYQKQPKPDLLSAHLYLPHVVSQKQIIQPLQITFGNQSTNSVDQPEIQSNEAQENQDQDNNNQDSDDQDSQSKDNNTIDETDYLSVAPLDLIGKVVTQGVEITPAISGKWQWKTDKILTFIPESPWPSGTKFKIHFSKALFESTQKYRMSTWHAEFTTLPLTIKVSDFKFFQDIEHPELFKVSATVIPNYPIDNSTLLSNTKLFYVENHHQVPYSISYNPKNLEAYIQTNIDRLPDHPQSLKLKINKNIKPKDGGNSTQEDVEASIIIPDKNSVMQVKDIDATIVYNDKGQPEQIINVNTTLATTVSDLRKLMHVYLLPRNNSFDASTDDNDQEEYTWNSPKDVDKSLLKQEVELIPIPTEHDFETLHSFKIHVKPGRYLYIAIESGLSSYRNYSLKLPYANIIQVPEYPKEINFLHKGSLLALTGEKKVSVVVRGLPAVKFTIARVLPEEINHLVTQTSGNFQNPKFINYSFDASNISIISSKIEIFNDDDPSKAQYIALDLAKYLHKNPFKLGLFLLKAEGYDPTTKDTTDTKANRLILITDNDMLVKNNDNGSHDIFVHSITKGGPVADAQVSVLGANGLALVTKNTDMNGHIEFPSLKDFANDKAPTVYIVKNGNDISFMPYSRYDRTLNYSRFDTGGDTTTHRYGLNAFLFNDRGIYRPGEEIHLGLIVKGDYAFNTIPDIPLELVINDPTGKTVYDKKFSSNNTGFLTESFITSTGALAGNYTAELYIVKDNAKDDLLGSNTFQVQEFEPDQLKISANFDPTPTPSQGWVSPDNLKANVQLLNLFGTPATNRNIKGTLYFAPQVLQFDAYPDVIFNDPYSNLSKPGKVFSENLEESKTDNEGQAIFNLDLSHYGQSTYQLTLLATGFALDGGRGVSKATTVLVSPLKYLIGYKSEDNNFSYIRKNTKTFVHFIAVNPGLKQITIKNLKVKILKLNKIATLVKQSDGSYQYQTVIQEHKTLESSFAILESGNNYFLPTNQIGNYKIQIFDASNLLLSQVPFSVISPSENVTDQEPFLQVKLNSHSYQPGETIALHIKSPYTGSGLITIERDRVYTYKWFKINTTSKIETIKIPSDFVGTGYVNVSLIRDWNSDKIFTSPLGFNVQDFSVIPKSRQMNIKLNIPKRIYPGRPLDIKYSTDKPGNIIIYAVDEGILQVADYQTPDPLGYYFQKQALSVGTDQTADQILPKYIAKRELSTIGGDEKQKSAASNLNPFARKLVPVVYWSGIIHTDSRVNSVLYNVPDYFNGSLRVMAVAVNPQAIGATSNKVEVRDDFVLTPNVPGFVAPKDQFEVSISVANTTNFNSAVKLKIKPSTFIENQGTSLQTISIPTKTEKSVTFKLKARDLLGSTHLNFVLLADNKTFEKQTSISIRPVTPYQATINSGYSNNNKTINVTRNLYPELRTLQAVSSTNPFILLKGISTYFKLYPYNCTEQIVSQAFVNLALQNQPGLFNQNKSLDFIFNQTIQILRQRQSSDGYFNYWPNQNSQLFDPFVTIYTTDFLTEAKIRKYEIPQDILANAIAYLKNYASTNPNSMDDARLHAYAIYVLTRNDIITTSYIANLQEYFQQNKSINWQHDITSAYLASAYKMLQNIDMADKLIKNYQLSKVSSDEFYNQTVMDAQYITVLANYFPDRLRNLKPTSLMLLVNNISSNNINSLTAATSALALSNFTKASQVKNGNSNLSISVIDKNGNSKALTSESFGPNVEKVSFGTKNNTGYFYQVIQSGFDYNLPVNNIKSGIEVYREYQNQQGNSITSTSLGNELIVHIRIRATKNQNFDNIALVDLLPGGFELVPDSIASSDGLSYFDAREDRIIFYLTATSNLQEYTYHIRAINRGIFNIPPAFATSMYNPQILASQKGGIMEVR